GRNIQFNYDTNKNLSNITEPAMGSGTQTMINFYYGSGNLTNIENPATQTGYTLSYTSYGMVNNVSLRRQMNEPTGNGVESASVSLNYPTSLPSGSAPAFTTRTESPNSGTYSYSGSSGTGTKLFTITRPDSSTLVLTRSDDSTNAGYRLMTQAEVKN